MFVNVISILQRALTLPLKEMSLCKCIHGYFDAQYYARINKTIFMDRKAIIDVSKIDENPCKQTLASSSCFRGIQVVVVVLCLTSPQQLRSYGDGATA